MKNIVLLDRDGSVIVDPPDERVTEEAKIKLFPDTLSALKTLADNNFDVVLITNQAGISEGRITVEDFKRINAEVVRQLEVSGVKVLKSFMCPHVNEDKCNCRKPLPTMVAEAIDEFNLIPEKTYMVGDHRSDVLAGQAAGTKGILVKTANHKDFSPEADYTAQNLTEVVDFIISTNASNRK